ncbi:MAG: carboxylesterase [Microbacteriaceae bacterium]|nr:carboxylesterase [Microbacteriaceae bacterium]
MSDRIIQTTRGPVTGLSTAGVESFLGIPYAAAPVGERRFLPPVPHAAWNEPFAATTFGATALQELGEAAGGLPDVPEPIVLGDDSLNLNVWTTASDGEAPRPVLVWIHGGGFFAGCSANPWYDGASFARHGLVVVSLNYRLGAEGFLLAPGIAPNLAMLDWIAALEWVRDNVAAFGGDPAQVTVMGQSAGGMAVTALLASPAARGLFSRAIIASGVSQVGAVTEPVAEDLARDLLTAAGASVDVAGARSVTREQLVASLDTVAADREKAGTPLTLAWAPVVDGDLLPGAPLEAVAQGAGADIPVLVGSARNEFAWRTIMGVSPDDPDYEQKRLEGQHLYADDFFRRAIDEFSKIRAATNSAPTYRYEFQWRSTAEPYIGAGHSLDIPFFFNNLSAPYVEPYSGPNPPQQLADAMHGAFANFALTGDPGWAPYDAENEAVMAFDSDSHVVRGVVFEN